MLQKDGSIIINEWNKGMAQSPYLGFELMKNVDIKSSVGSVKINTAPATMTFETAPTKLCTWLDYGKTTATASRLFAAGGAIGVVYDSGDARWEVYGATGNMGADGMVTYSGSNAAKAYIIHAKDANLNSYDCDNLSSGDTDFLTATGDLQDVTWHPMRVASNDVIYIGNGRYVASLGEKAGQTFDPASSATYDVNLTALDLPSDVEVTCLEELAGYLMIGTRSIIKPSYCQIFMWDKSSASFEYPIKINNASGVNQMVTYGGTLYAQAGSKGEWFATNGTSVQKIGELPQHLVGEKYLSFYPGAVTVVKGKIFFGVSTGSSGSGLCGIWSLDPQTGAVIFEHTISTGNYGQTNVLNIGAIMATSNNSFIYSYEDNTTYGIDQVSLGGSLYASSNAIIDSQLYRVGTKSNKKTFKSTELYLAKPLAANESVVVQYRTANNGSWTTHFTFNTADQQSYYGPALPALENVQFRFILDTGTSATGPEILEFRAI